MRRIALWGPLMAVAMAVPGVAGEGPRRPKVELRASPRMAFGPVSVLVVAQLQGGDEHEDFYCPDVEWDFGDGSRSSHQADCEPFAEGMALERHFRTRHAYWRPGEYDVKVTFRRATRTLAVSSARVTVHSGIARGPELR